MVFVFFQIGKIWFNNLHTKKGQYDEFDVYADTEKWITDHYVLQCGQANIVWRVDDNLIDEICCNTQKNQ